MTMDITNRKVDIAADVFLSKPCEDQRTTELPVAKSKRSFDVAFLMLPDDKSKKDASKVAKFLPAMASPVRQYEDLGVSADAHSPSTRPDSDDEDEEIEVDAPKIDLLKVQTQKFYLTQKQQIFGDPQLGKPKICPAERAEQVKSAFTKINLKDGGSGIRLSPNLSISPDLSYQNSLSPSPPINRSYHQQNFPGMLSPNHIFKAHNAAAPYQTQFLQIPENFPHAPETGAPFILKSPNPELLQPSFAKMRATAAGMLPQYPPRPDLSSYNYATQFHQQQEMLKMAQQHHQHQQQHPVQQPPPDIRNPSAAALLTSLLPPSLAALSLPAQNVCAKCNISFRMTSDLVYHMRSHHKNETTDYNRRKREEKLKCPVCAESFRERHHLTRHMTAHQDKDNDGDMAEVKAKKFLAAYAK